MRALAAALLLGGCAGGTGGMPATPPPPAQAADAGLPADSWRRYATADDRRRLHDWRQAFVAGLAEARADGHGAALAAEAALFEPDAALTGPTIPAGTYRCRMTKLGRRGGTGLAYVAYGWFRCTVGDAAPVQAFEKLSGSQRQVGALYDDGGRRRVFLGTLALGDERTARRYGADAQRDLIGALERIGERRWRLLLPYPRFESLIDVMEIVPE